jgi:hypothetical protein
MMILAPSRHRNTSSTGNVPTGTANYNITAFAGDRKEDAQKVNKCKGP